jgi:hypothetical protein
MAESLIMHAAINDMAVARQFLETGIAHLAVAGSVVTFPARLHQL